MKKLDLAFGFSYLILAIFSTFFIVKECISGESIGGLDIFGAFLMYACSGMYFYCSISISQHQKRQIQKLREMYAFLKGQYEVLEVLNLENERSVESVRSFEEHICEFGGIVFDINTMYPAFPKKIQEESQVMLADLLTRLFQLTDV